MILFKKNEINLHMSSFIIFTWNIFFKPTLVSLCTYDGNKKIIKTIYNVEKCTENFLKSYL